MPCASSVLLALLLPLLLLCISIVALFVFSQMISSLYSNKRCWLCAQVGCTIIEKAATEKAVRDIDVKLGPAVADRKTARQMRQKYFDAARVAGRFPNALPSLLRPQVRPKPQTPRAEGVVAMFRLSGAPASMQEQSD